MKMSERTAKREAFTLLEIIIALSMLVLILGSVYGTYTAAIRSLAHSKPKHALQAISKPEPSTEKSVEIVLEKHQALVQWVRHGPSRHDEDYMGALVLNHMLGGGGFGSRLMEEIREKRGLAYQVGSSFDARKESGIYFSYIGTKPESYQESKKVLILHFELIY